MGYDKPRYTQTPNLFLDEHLPEMGHAETKVVLAVIRKTFGWHKDEDRISVSQFEELTGLSRQGVQNGIKDAMQRGVLGRVEEGQGYRYYLVVNEVEHPDDEVCNEVERGMQRSRTEVCNEVETQKKGKETNPKESERAPAREDEQSEDPVAVLCSLWNVSPTTYQSDQIRQIVDDLTLWKTVLRDLKMQNKDSKKAIGWAVEDYQDEVSDSLLTPEQQADPDWTVVNGERHYQGVPISELGPQQLNGVS